MLQHVLRMKQCKMWWDTHSHNHSCMLSVCVPPLVRARASKALKGSRCFPSGVNNHHRQITLFNQQPICTKTPRSTQNTKHKTDCNIAPFATERINISAARASIVHTGHERANEADAAMTIRSPEQAVHEKTKLYLRCAGSVALWPGWEATKANRLRRRRPVSAQMCFPLICRVKVPVPRMLFVVTALWTVSPSVQPGSSGSHQIM